MTDGASVSCPMTFVFFRLMVSPKSLQACEKQPINEWSSSWAWVALLNTVYPSTRPSKVDMLCFRPVMLVRSFTANKISGTLHQPLFACDIRNSFVFVLVLKLQRICKMCCPTSDIHSTVVLEYAMWSSAGEKIPSDPVAGRVRGIVVGQGSYQQKTLSGTRIMVV